MNIGIAGAGGIAGKMAETLNQMETAHAYAIASRDYIKAKAFAEKYNIKKIYGSYEEMFKDTQVDLVYIATPHIFHYEQMKQALNYGKHVLCEKAFTINAAQAEEVLNLGKRKKLLAAEGMWTRYLPLRNILNDIIHSGAIGETSFLSANFVIPISHIERIVNPALAGGALLDIGVYTINFALMTFGDDIEKIQSSMIPFVTGVDIAHSIIFTYNNGKMAVLRCNAKAAGNCRCTVEGDKGFIELDHVLNAQKAVVYDANHTIVLTKEVPVQITGFEYEVESCRKAIESGSLECPEMPHSEILKVLDITDRIRKDWGFKYPGEP